MKFTSWLALSALFGRSLVKGKRNWKDALLAYILFRNEVQKKDGVARKALRQLSKECAEARSEIQKPRQHYKQGFWGSFLRGFRGRRE